MEELLFLSKSFSIKMKRLSIGTEERTEITLFKIAQYVVPAGRLHQKLQYERQNLAYTPPGRDHISAE